MDETVVIHGTGMDQSQFNKMGTTGAGLVWSPFSNLVLYGDTTDVVAADNAGITISIAPDWGPSGTKNNLHELKVADVIKAIENIVSGKTNLNTYDCGQVFEAFKDNDLGLIDSSIADSILQITTYNTLVYG